MLTTLNNRIMLSDSSYAFAKKLVQVIIPALSAAYFGLASIWGLPAADKVTGTAAVLATLLGVILGVSSNQYEKSQAGYDGRIVTQQVGDKTVFALELNTDPEELVKDEKKSVRFLVQPTEEAP